MGATQAYTIDTSRHPIIRIKWHHDCTSEDLQSYFGDLTAILDAKKKVTLWLDVAPQINFKTEERLLMSRWLRDHEDEIEHYILGTCFVTSSALVGMALRAVFIFAPPKNAWKITTSQSDAETWCRGRQASVLTAMAS